MESYKTGDKVLVVANPYVPDYGFLHHYKIGEIVRVVRVTESIIYCIGPKGLEQALRPTQIKLIKRYKKGD